MDPRWVQRITLSLFFATGACGLVYQVVWVRQLSLSFGISTYAISAVLAAFMSGLCMGAWILGRRADRFRNPLRVYALIEIAIATYALGLYFVLSAGLPHAYRIGHHLLSGTPLVWHVTRYGLAFLLLVVPTTLMGGTLPVLGRFFIDRAEHTGARVGQLYGVNTLGAVVGTLFAGFWSLKHLGVFRTTLSAALFNLIVGLIALLLSARVSAANDRVRPHEDSPLPSAVPVDLRLVHLMLFLAGFAAMAYEVLWNRTLLPYIGNSVYAFSLIVVMFLLGIGLGSLLFARLSPRWTRPSILGALQLFLGAYVWATILLAGQMPRLLDGIRDAFGTDRWFSAVITVVVTTALFAFVPTLIMGITFPMATAVCSSDSQAVGSRIGRYYTYSTLGNILGALITGFVLVALAGVRTAFAVAIACNLLSGMLLLVQRSRSRWRVPSGILVTGTASGLFFVTVDRDHFVRQYSRQHGKAVEVLFYEEEAADTVMVIETANGDRWLRFFDGRGTAGTPTERSNRLFGHIPMLLHPDPQRVLSICFGVGNTLSALAQHRPERLICAELSAGAIDAGPYFPSNHDVLKTPGLEVVVEDGRNYLLTTEEKFDVIQLEPPEIHTASVVNLYTREFYELASERLSEDGIICQWLNVYLMPELEMKMLLRTFVDVFPQASLWEGGTSWDLLLIGSPDPILLDAETITARFDQPRVRTDLTRIQVPSPASLLSYHVMDATALLGYLDGVRGITDDRTYVDFSVPQASESAFGVFLYASDLVVEAAKNPHRARQRLEMLANRQCPTYLIAPSPGREALVRHMEVISGNHRRHSQAMLYVFEGQQLQADGDLQAALAQYELALQTWPDLEPAARGVQELGRLLNLDVDGG